MARLRSCLAVALLSLPACTPDVASDGGTGASMGITADAATTTSGKMGMGGAGGSIGSSVATGSTSPGPFCGDGEVNTPGEGCDDGPGDAADGCSAGCVMEGDTCANPVAIPVALGEQIVLGSTESFASNKITDGGCGMFPGSERHFELTPSTSGFLTLWSAPTGSAPGDFALYILDQCGGAVLSCADNVEGAPDVLSFLVTAGQALHLAVDGHASGPFELHVDLSSGDSCSDPVPLPIGPHGSQEIAVTGSTAGLTNDNNPGSLQMGGCGGGTSPDVVYEVRPTNGGSASTLAAIVGSGSFEPSVYSRSPCETQLAGDCSGDGTPSPPAYTFSTLGATRYLWVDGAASTFGAYTLVVTP